MMRTHKQKHRQSSQGTSGDLARSSAAARRQVHSILHSQNALQRKCSCGGTCPECRDATPPIVDEVLHSSGQPLDPETRGFMELRFGQDFSHVIHQTGGSASAPALQRAVVTSGCDELPYDKKKVEDAAKRTYDHVKTSGCIQNESLRKDVLEKLGSLKIRCRSGGKEGPCGRAEHPRTVHLYEAIIKSGLCPEPMDAAIFHEAIHLTESFSISHGSLSWDCGEACYPGADKKKRGDASKCGFERDALPMLALSAGGALSGKGTAATYFRLYAGLEKRRLIFSFVDASLGVGASFIGEPVGGEPDVAPSGRSALISLIGALRFDPGKMGRHYFSVSGGLGVPLVGEKALGAVAGLGGGYRWSKYDISFNAGIDYNPARNRGEEKMYMLSASFSYAQKVRP